MKMSHSRIRKHMDIKVQCIEIYKPINESSSRFNTVEAERNEPEDENVKRQRTRITEKGLQEGCSEIYVTDRVREECLKKEGIEMSRIDGS